MIEPAADYLIDRDYWTAHIRANCFCESEIEVYMGTELLIYAAHIDCPLVLSTMGNVWRQEPNALLLVPQYSWSRYRADWAIARKGASTGLFIECDGHDYHTHQDQIRRDTKKDQDALDRGWSTLRFSGSRIYRFPDRCAREVLQAVLGGEPI